MNLAKEGFFEHEKKTFAKFVHPKVKLCSPLGSVVLPRLWLKASPNVKVCTPFGSIVLSRL